MFGADREALDRERAPSANSRRVRTRGYLRGMQDPGQPADPRPFRVRFQLPLTLIPFAAGIATAVPLWGDKAPQLFFTTAAEVIALGAVGMALQGRFFRLSSEGRPDSRSVYTVVSTGTLLISVGVGLAFAFGALIRGNAGTPHLALTMGALAMGISAFAVQALFGAPGVEED
jgi:hypothetical protein